MFCVHTCVAWHMYGGQGTTCVGGGWFSFHHLGYINPLQDVRFERKLFFPPPPSYSGSKALLFAFAVKHYSLLSGHVYLVKFSSGSTAVSFLTGFLCCVNFPISCHPFCQLFPELTRVLFRNIHILKCPPNGFRSYTEVLDPPPSAGFCTGLYGLPSPTC